MLKDSIIKKLNIQLNREYQSAIKYRGMAVYCDNNDLPGSAHWLLMQSDEERSHAEKIYAYLNDMGAKIELEGLEEPKQEFDNVLDVFKAALAAEEEITEHLTTLADAAQEEKDQLTFNFLQWFLTEQVEEIASVHEIITDINRLGTEGTGLFMLDEKLAKRTTNG